MIKKLEEAYNAYYDTSKGMPYDIDATLRETAICLENSLDEINRQKAEIAMLTNLCQEQNTEIKRQIEIKNRLLYNLKLVCEEKVGEG